MIIPILEKQKETSTMFKELVHPEKGLEVARNTCILHTQSQGTGKSRGLGTNKDKIPSR